MTIAWLMLLVAIFLTAGAVRLGAMGVAFAAAAADVLTQRRARAERAVAVFLSAFAAASVWSATIVGVLAPAIEEPTVLRAGFLGVGAVAAAAPGLVFAVETARARQAGKEVVVAIGFAAIANLVLVLAAVALLGGL
jgi:hypothetical protein